MRVKQTFHDEIGTLWSRAQTDLMNRYASPGVPRGVRGLDEKVVALCAVIFLGDIVLGLLISTFSVYARISGMSIAAIGLVNTVSGLTQLGVSVPFGILSDRSALVLDVAAMFGIYCTRSPGAIVALLAIDGLAYGGFVVSGQTLVS